MRVISRWFEIPGANDFSLDKFDACIDAIRRVRLELKRDGWRWDTGLRRAVKRILGSRAHMAYLLCRLDWSMDTIIWKDPIACFASKAAMDRHAIPVVVSVRPPAAVAASYKRLGWKAEIPSLLTSLSQIGISFGDLMRRYGDQIDDPCINGAVLWHIVHRTLLNWRRTSSLMYFVDLQDSIDRPSAIYQSLYGILGLDWTERVSEKLHKRYDRSMPSSVSVLPNRAHVMNRRLIDINTYGKTLLSPDEVARVESINSDLWHEVQAACLFKKSTPDVDHQN